MQYFYSTMRGVATLNKGDNHKLVRIGKFASEAEALAACKAHYAKACAALAKLGVSAPEAYYL